MASTARSTAPERVLFIRLHGLGDVLMATPAIRAARQVWPQARLSMLVGQRAAPAVRGLAYLDELIEVPETWFFGHDLKALARLARRLRQQRFDLAIVFSRSAPLYFWAKLAGVRRVISHRRWSGLRGPHQESRAGAVLYEARQNLDLVLSLLPGLEVTDSDLRLVMDLPEAARERARELLAGLPPGLWLVLAPGGGENAGWAMPQKQWPAAHFGRLAARVHEERGGGCVIIGAPADADLARQISELTLGAAVDATGENDLAVSAALIEAADLLVCNDSVAMHLGLMFDAPTVALFGPTNPAAVLPPDTGRMWVVQAPVDCAPCYWQDAPQVKTKMGRGRGFVCSRPQGPCLNELSPEAVWPLVEDALGHRGQKG